MTSVEFPNEAYYTISDNLRNNVFWIQISLSIDEPSDTHEIRLPDGNFLNANEITDYINTTYFSNNTSNPLFNELVCCVDPLSLKTRFYSRNLQIYFAFIFYDPVATPMRENTLGWFLGFRLPLYSFCNQWESESVVGQFTKRNLFFAFNDYQYNNNNNNLVLLGQTMLDDYILAKYTLDPKNNSLLSFPKIYNGPVNLRKLNVKVYNENGHVIDMNGLDFSCTLEMTLLYENFNF